LPTIHPELLLSLPTTPFLANFRVADSPIIPFALSCYVTVIGGLRREAWKIP
jgi:hypothetical protein